MRKNGPVSCPICGMRPRLTKTRGVPVMYRYVCPRTACRNHLTACEWSKSIDGAANEWNELCHGRPTA